MRAIAERRGTALVEDPLETDDVRRLLRSVLLLHQPEDPRRFPDTLIAECDRLLPSDRADWDELRSAWAERSGQERDPDGILQPPLHDRPTRRVRLLSSGHRLELLGAASRRVFVVVLERFVHPFGARDLALAEALQPHIGPAFDHARLRAAEWVVADTIKSLTVREQEVLALVADGRTNRDIGLALFIEPRTVEKHVENIRTKLGARSRAEAAAKWARAVGVPVW